MSDPSSANEFRESLVAAVQAELTRHGQSITAELDRIRKENVEDRANLRRELNGQIADLARLVADVQVQAESGLERLRVAHEARLSDMESRQSRRLDDVTANLSSAVQAAARPILAEATAEHERSIARLDGLELQLRKFDEQAARMVTYVTDVIQRVEARQGEVAQELQAQVAAEVSGLRPLVDDIDSSVRRFQSDISAQVSTRLNDAEDRFNTRLMAAEARMKDAAGTQIAEVQAHVGRVNAHIDETLAVLNNRHDQMEVRFAATDQRVDELVESVQGVDRTALDEMASKVSSAIGEAMLVRIEMERLEKAVGERTDELIVRVAEVETQLIDATMDVSTAIQLERLEELERAVLELDPTRFVAYDPAATHLLHDGANGHDAERTNDVHPGGGDSDQRRDPHPGVSVAGAQPAVVSNGAVAAATNGNGAASIPPPPSVAAPMLVSAPGLPPLPSTITGDDSLNGSRAGAEEISASSPPAFAPPIG